VHAEAAPEGVAHPVGESDRSGEGETSGEFGEREHNDKSSSKCLSLCIDAFNICILWGGAAGMRYRAHR